MKKYAADNLMLLREQYPDIYALIRNKPYDGDMIQVTESRNKQRNLWIHIDGKKQTLYSRYEPENEVERWLETLKPEFEQVKNVLLCGLGLGYHAKKFLEHYPDKKLFIYEPDINIFIAAIENCDLRPILKSKQLAMLAIGPDEGIQHDLMRSIYMTLSGEFHYSIVPVYRKLFPDICASLLKTIGSVALTYRSNLQTVTKHQISWANNIILNLEKVIATPSFKSFKGLGEGIPAVIVGSGPSLEMDIEWLRKLKNRVMIIAAGSSVQGLVHHGIEPDLVVSMDPSPENDTIFSNVSSKNIPFLFIPTITHSVLDQGWECLTHAFFSNDQITQYYLDLTDEDPIFASTGTVTGTCIQAALYMKCSEIVFVGQDFSYPNDQFYAQGVSHIDSDTLNQVVSDSDEWVENVAGGYNRTNKSMLVLKQSIEYLMDRFSFSEYYNASSVGAVIRNTKPKSLKQLYEEQGQTSYREGWFAQLIREKASLLPEHRVRQATRKIERTIKEIPKLLELVNKIEKHVLKVNDSDRRDRKKLLKSWFNEFDQYWNEFTEHEVFKYLYMYLLQRECNYAARYWSDVHAETDAEIKFRRLVDIVRPILEGFQSITPTLQQNFDQLAERLKLTVRS